MDRLAGEVAVVTGAAGRLGFAGARAMAAQAVASCGALHVLWNNAALVRPDWLLRDTDVLGISRDHLMKTLDVNLGSVFLGCKHAVPVMAESGGGSIINSSAATAAGGDLVFVAHGTSKAAVNHLSKSVATSVGHLGIRCNALAPGAIPAPAVDGETPAPRPLGGVVPQRLVLDSQMLDVAGEPRDVADAVVFLASDESKFITGQGIHVDGGFTGHLPTPADRRKLQPS